MHDPPPRDFTLYNKVVFPLIKKLIALGYFSLEIRGLRHLPRRGNWLLAGNHSGWFTLDSLMVAFAIRDTIGDERIPYPIINDVLLKTPGLGALFKRLGVIPASWLKDFKTLPTNISTFGVYPEGADGICKPFWKAYQMAPWKTGFVRLAIARKAKVIPITIIGGEECLPTSLPIKILKPFIGSAIPVPLVGFPLPTSWKIILHEPVDFSVYPEEKIQDKVFCSKLARQIRSIIQLSLDFETTERPLARLSQKVAAAKASIPLIGGLSTPDLPKRLTENHKMRKRRLIHSSIRI